MPDACPGPQLVDARPARRVRDPLRHRRVPLARPHPRQLVLLFGAYAFVDGTFAIAAALVGRSGGLPWWAMLVEGLIGVAAGIATVAWPGLTALASALT